MPEASRRRFLGALAGAGLLAAARLGAEQRGLEQFMVPAPPCKDDLTPMVPAGSDYKAGAPLRSSLAERGATGTRITIAGYVTGLACGRIKDARIDFWHADASGVLDNAGYRFRGAVTTDAEGRYRVETVAPGARAGRARRIGARVQPPGKPAFTTVLFFPEDPAAERDSAYKPLLVMKRAAAGGPNAFTFDFLLDL